jgi:DegV family protein with EDD domain
MTVAVLTDSAAALPPELAAEWGIMIVPMLLTIGEETHRDGELSISEVGGRLGEGITTSAPSPGEFTAALEALPPDVDAAVVLTIASTMSAGFNAARTAASVVDRPVEVIDTQTAAGAQGLVALEAAAAAAAGASLEEVATAARAAARSVRLVATIENLDQLMRSGRVPGLAGWAAGMLHVNPLFEFRTGDVHRLRPARSRAQAMQRMLDLWRSSDHGPTDRLHVAALHARQEDDARHLLDVVRAETEPVTAFVAPFSPVMVAHVGDDLIGLAWWWEPGDQSGAGAAVA